MSYPETEPIRDASRRMVRELGFLGDEHHGPDLTSAACHSLLELRRRGVCTIGELADLLRIDKSTATRTVAQLMERGWVAHAEDPDDRRRKPISLTATGQTTAEQVDGWARAEVDAALGTLSPEERRTALAGLATYARGLERARRQRQYSLRAVAPHDDAQVAALIRAVMTEHGACGPGFAIHDPEVNAMSAAYTAPKAGYFVVSQGPRVLGAGGFAPLGGGPTDTCELRKMYFYPELRGLGFGARLLGHILEAARDAGYRTCYLETLDSMKVARRLYAAFGFQPLEGPMGATGHHACDMWYARPL